MFELDGNCLIIDRHDANELFSRIGCVNAPKWDEMTMVKRLFRAPRLRDYGDVGDFLDLLDAIQGIGHSGEIILRNDKPATVPLITILEKKFGKSAGSKRVKEPKKRTRGATFSFEKCHIPPGSVLCLKKDPSVTCTVVGDPWLVDFGDGEMRSFTSRTRELLGVKDTTYLSPQFYWTFEGELLSKYYDKYQRPKSRKKEAKTM